MEKSLMFKLQEASREQQIEFIKAFYRIANDVEYEVPNLDNDKLFTFVQKLVREAYYRDSIYVISQRKSPNLVNQLYKSFY